MADIQMSTAQRDALAKALGPDYVGSGWTCRVRDAADVDLLVYVWTGALGAANGSGVFAFGAPDSATALGLAAGTASYAVFEHGGVGYLRLSAGVSGSGMPLILSALAVAVGDPLDWVSGTLTEPHAAALS